MKRIKVITLGCSKNSVDTEHLLSALPADDFRIVQEPPFDYLLYNTCGFIGDAKEESIQAVLDGVRAKGRGDVSNLVVFGCLSQRYEAQMPSLIPEVDAWFGARDLNPLLRYLGAPASRFTSRLQENPRGYAYLKISEGCDRRCSYCAIPFIRGAHRSVPMEDLEAEARQLVSEGVSELILIAQDTTFYGLDLYGRRALASLLERLSAIDGVERLRIHYSYPTDFPDDVLEQMAHNPKVCKYLDIPLQHISDRVLDNMHRHIDSARTRALINKLREKVPGVVLRTTMIVGHPGEGVKEFGELMDFVREARFERLGAFAYSEEEGTWGAGHLKDDVPEEEKRRRLEELMSVQADISLNYNRSRVGSTVRVLVDDIVNGTLVCRSEGESPEVDGEILVSTTKADEAIIGSYIDVRITGADEYDLTAVQL
ncbi:MAG: 30S ribosomal protein S12 methylthiotransferase RimO [Bacteroidales bacterium]|nr:30S ribosomal protein S12 methylthiotransferase RimO [Bacteroidales bacterium]MBQ2228903.1 30S ribosomal protein S12 methylthiotransferase RimO [Bacteroidales bacterium]